jgi:serine/threonine-protein kinase RsbW
MIDNLTPRSVDKAAYRPRCRGAWPCEEVHTTAEIERVLERVREALDQAGYSEKERFGVRLALEEAMVNAVKHGHQGDPTKTVRVRYRVTPASVTTVVEDEGSGFNPADVPDPLAPENLEKSCGRGLLLMRSYMTWVRHNAAANCVTMCKTRGG